MDRLWAHGHAAYIVGGSVRDALLDRPAEDWDLATDARPDRLLAVFPRRTTVSDRAIAAVARADVAENHEGRGSFFPALTDVRTVGFLADGVEIPLAHEPAQSEVVRTAGSANLEPGRLAPIEGHRRLEQGK